MLILKIILFSLAAVQFNFILRKKNILLSYSGNKHQLFTQSKKAVLTLGSIFFFFILFFLVDDFDLKFIVFLFIFYFVGIISDINVIKSPKFRFVIQFFLICLFVFFNDLRISSLRFTEIDELLHNHYFNFFFVSFCLLVLINGSNFVDGLNGLLTLFYFIIILILNFHKLIFFEFNSIILIIYIFSFCLILNFSNKSFLGDNGVYVLSLLMGYVIILSFKANPTVSPFFYGCLLFYPAFENLFSIIRKLYFSKNPLLPDNYHLHQMIYFFFKKKYKLNSLLCNNLSSISINIFCLLVFLISSLNIQKTNLQIFCILIFLTVYLFVYFILYKKLKKFN